MILRQASWHLSHAVEVSYKRHAAKFDRIFDLLIGKDVRSGNRLLGQVLHECALDKLLQLASGVCNHWKGWRKQEREEILCKVVRRENRRHIVHREDLLKANVFEYIPEDISVWFRITFRRLDIFPQVVEPERWRLLKILFQLDPDVFSFLRCERSQVDYASSKKNTVTENSFASRFDIRKLLINTILVLPDVLLNCLCAHVRDLGLFNLATQLVCDLLVCFVHQSQLLQLILLYSYRILSVIYCKYVRINLHLDLLDPEVCRCHSVLDIKFVVQLFEVIVQNDSQLGTCFLFLVVGSVASLLDELIESSEGFFIERHSTPFT